jgi:ADP-ribose pyrophosphatase YjhB (NUDIX family)
MTQPMPIARDREEYTSHADGQDWIVSWHSPVLPPPDGKPHGSAAVCLISEGNIILVSSDGEYWDCPGGRPEGDEDWRTTLEREVLEEACAQVEEAVLLGFARSVCVRGHEEGLVLVRSLWWAVVSIHQWEPQYEISHRLLVPSDTALAQILAQDRFPHGLQPIYRRWFHEALNNRTPGDLC